MVKRRQFKRYMVKDNVFLVFRPDFDRLGKVKDISQGGVAFEYVLYRESYDASKPDFAEIDIFSNGNLHLSKAFCRVVYDIPSYPEEFKGFRTFVDMEIRRCGLEFRKLNTEQKEDLEFFLKSSLIEEQTRNWSETSGANLKHPGWPGNSSPI
jgi:hypothetical protein